MLIRKKPAKWRVNSYYVQQEFEKGEFTMERMIVIRSNV